MMKKKVAVLLAAVLLISGCTDNKRSEFDEADFYIRTTDESSSDIADNFSEQTVSESQRKSSSADSSVESKPESSSADSSVESKPESSSAESSVESKPQSSLAKSSAESKPKSSSAKNSAESKPKSSSAKNSAESKPKSSSAKSVPERIPDMGTEQVPSTSAITVTSFSSVLYRNKEATVEIKGQPNTEYRIEVIYSSGASTAKGLENKISDSNGIVSWTWKVGGRTKTGGGKTIKISGGGDSITLTFSVE